MRLLPGHETATGSCPTKNSAPGGRHSGLAVLNNAWAEVQSQVATFEKCARTYIPHLYMISLTPSPSPVSGLMFRDDPKVSYQFT